MNYFLLYYSKYFKGNFYVNYSTQGLSESIGFLWVGLLSKKFEPKQLTQIMTILMILCCVTMAIVEKNIDPAKQGAVIPILLFLSRL